MLSHAEMVARLLAAYSATDGATRAAGRGWYRDARRIARRLGRQHGMTPSRVAAVIAALSPRQRWRVNVTQAERLLAGWDGPYSAFPRQLEKARAIINGARPADVLTGIKEHAFWRAIAGDDTAVTVDRWAIQTATGETGARAYETLNKDNRARRAIAAAFTEAAELAGERPREFQAILWIAERGNAQ